MTGVRIAADPAPAAGDEQAMRDGLLAFSAGFIGPPNEQPLAVLARRWPEYAPAAEISTPRGRRRRWAGGLLLRASIVVAAPSPPSAGTS